MMEIGVDRRGRGPEAPSPVQARAAGEQPARGLAEATGAALSVPDGRGPRAGLARQEEHADRDRERQPERQTVQ
jgi:hypothetical protein